MTGYELHRQDHVRRALALVPELAEAWTWPAERIAAERTARLRSLVEVAVARSPWHRKRLAGIDLGLPGEELLAALPVMTKDDLMANFDEIVTDPRLSLAAVEAHLEAPEPRFLLDEYSAWSSGGSSGRRGCFVYDPNGTATFYVGCFLHLLRERLQAGLEAPAPVVAMVAAGHRSHPSAGLARIFTGEHLPTIGLPVSLPVEELVRRLNELRPEILTGYPSTLHLLANEARTGRLRVSPRRVMTYAEPLLPEARTAIEGAWGRPVGNLYVTTEGGATGIPCDHGGLHLADSLIIVEPVDEGGRGVPAGTRAAKIYLTNLYNHTQPMIRLEITDEVTLLDDPCACGSAHRRIADVHGRLDDTFCYAGRSVHPHAFRSALGRRPEVTEYQVRQTERGASIDIRCTAPIDTAGLGAEIEEELRRLGVVAPVAEVRVVEAIERGAMGKIKRFVPLAVDGRRA